MAAVDAGSGIFTTRSIVFWRSGNTCAPEDSFAPVYFVDQMMVQSGLFCDRGLSLLIH